MHDDKFGFGPKDAERSGDWACTASGRMFYPLDPRPSDIDIHDIAQALSKICRFGGHCMQFYSVAQHSVLVAWLVSEKIKQQGEEPQASSAARLLLAAILHDASDAYVGDMVRPLKHQPEMATFRRAEELNMQAIAAYFEVPLAIFDDPVIRWADNVALAIEAHSLMPEASVKRWNLPLAPEDVVIRDRHIIDRALSPDAAYVEFISYFEIIAGMHLTAPMDPQVADAFRELAGE